MRRRRYRGREGLANEPLRILTAFHGSFHAPVYLAQRLGLSTEEGLAVTIAMPELGGSVDAFASGDADIALSG
ncbi:MAG: ABC transporter substrate-binding protein [Chloroflexi bacterium]|nr:ABC transporter substrate-binding protein [Chloroflexota bacterium]